MKNKITMHHWVVLPVLALSLSAITFATAKILRHSAQRNVTTFLSDPI